MDTIKNKGRPAEILLVEDNYGDVLLTKKAFAGTGLDSHITVAGDGMEAISILQKKDGHEAAPTPDIILLDLNLPRKGGRDVLKEIKNDEKLKHIPVIMLTSSSAELDVVKSYNLHANGYIIKPVSLEQFSDVVKKLGEFWFSVSVLSEEKTT